MGRIGTTTGMLVLGTVLAASLQGCGSDGGSAAADAPTPSPSSAAATGIVLPDNLPALFPEIDLPLAGPGETVSDPIDPEHTLGIERSGEDGEDGEARLVVTGFGRTRSVALPAGWQPAVLGKRFDLGQAGSAWIVSQEGGDSDTWSMFLDGRRRLLPVRVDGGVPFGSGSDEQSHAFRTWVTRPGRIFTRVGIDGDRFRLYEWSVAGPGEGGSSAGGPAPAYVPTLATEDLGIICVDDLAQTATRC